MGMLGAPPNCRPECAIHQDCPLHLACINNQCKDPCVGTCGFNAECVTQNHQPRCSCLPGFDGDPFSTCNPIQGKCLLFSLRDVCSIELLSVVEAPRDPCNPSPCGSNALCKQRNGAGSCVCQKDFFGDPYVGCHPECVMNNDCEASKACLLRKCQDPCPGSCGLNAECQVVNHRPSCFCLPRYTGNALAACYPIVEQSKTMPVYSTCLYFI